MSGHVLEAASRAADEVARGFAVELYHVEMSGLTLRVLIDAPDGVSLDVCSRFSRALSDELDRRDLVAGRYILEVSSPGIERRLYRPRDYAAAAGRNVRVRTAAGTVEGRLVRADEAGVTLETRCEGAPAETIVGYGEIRSARVKATDAELFSKQKESEVTQ